MDWKITLTFVIASIITWIARSYLDSYVRKKGENLATKEDIEEITRKVEGVKSEVSVKLELIKWELGKKATIHRLAAEKEFEALAEIGKALYELQSATSSLRPQMDMVGPNEPIIERHNRRYQDWLKSFEAFRDSFQKPRLFLPQHLYRQFINIHRLSHTEGLGFEYAVRGGDEGHLAAKDYLAGQKNIEEMNNAVEEALSSIRRRYDIED
ncbi:MAG TPA: hypothetical protein VFQ47_01495 [Nitrososphaera sp.]|jgi:hypothetical protein|nr:hypothetical protein [Nitrososphaera sp.]